jgi:uncharacterized protein (DUF2141 family)
MKLHFGKILAVAILCLAASTAGFTQSSSGCKLIVHVDGFRNDKGKLGVTIFNSPDGWPEKNDKAFRHGPFPITGNTGTGTYSELPPGDYAVAVIHDENENKKLDRNFVGWPTEGFGFANNPKVLLEAPAFKAAVVHVTCPVTETTVHLIYK